eukprot:403332176
MKQSKSAMNSPKNKIFPNIQKNEKYSKNLKRDFDQTSDLYSESQDYLNSQRENEEDIMSSKQQLKSSFSNQSQRKNQKDIKNNQQVQSKQSTQSINQVGTKNQLKNQSTVVFLDNLLLDETSKLNNTTKNLNLSIDQRSPYLDSNISLPNIDYHIKDVMKKFQHKSLLDNANVRHFNSSDQQRIVSYVELLKQKQEREKKLLEEQQKIQKIGTFRKPTLRKGFSSMNESNFPDSDFNNEDYAVAQNHPHQIPERAHKMNSLQQKIKDLENMNYIKQAKTLRDPVDKNITPAQIKSPNQTELPHDDLGMFFEEDENDKRNQQLYQMLKEYKVCVIPDQKIITIDKMPNFSIIEGNIKQGLFKKTEFTKQSKQNYQNINSLQNSTLFYMQLNKDAHQHVKKNKSQDFQSQSMNSKRFNRITGIGACTRVETQEILEKRVKDIYQKQIIEQQESEMIDELLGPILEREIPNFNSLPPMKRLVLALKTKVGQEELKKNLSNANIQQKRTFRQVFEEYHKINTFKKRIGLDQGDVQNRKVNKTKIKRKTTIDDERQLEKLPPDLRFFHKFKSIIRKQIRSIINNETLENAYKYEKRKLEIDILRANEKNKVTQVIINQIDSDEAQDPRPQYRYTYYKQRIKQLKRQQKRLQSQNQKEQIGNQNNRNRQNEIIMQFSNRDSQSANNNYGGSQQNHKNSSRNILRDIISSQSMKKSQNKLNQRVSSPMNQLFNRSFNNGGSSNQQQYLSMNDMREGQSLSDSENDSDEISSQELLDNVFFDRKDYKVGGGGSTALGGMGAGFNNIFGEAMKQRNRILTMQRPSAIKSLQNMSKTEARRQSFGGIQMSNNVSKLLDDRINQELENIEQIISQ